MKTSSNEKRYAIGVDYGTNSVRAIIVDIADGTELVSAVDAYSSGEEGVIIDRKDPLLARQNPVDYINGFYRCVSEAVKLAEKSGVGFSPKQVVGIGIDTTGSTPIPVDDAGLPLAMQKRFENVNAAQAWLWKDHTAFAEAREITEKAAKNDVHYLDKCGGIYSSEWFWSKIWHCKREDPDVFAAAYSWVELADFIPAFITGNTKPETLSRNICAAGHKAMYNAQWNGLPSEKFLESLDPDLVSIRRRFADTTKTSDQIAGYLDESTAAKTALLPGIPVAVGALDCHMGAVGAGVKPGRLVKIIGTSTCDVMVHPLDEPLEDIPGVCGIVSGSVLPDMYGIEAGQSAVGDIFKWFIKNLTPEKYTVSQNVHAELERDAAALKPGESGLLALDWQNGNRTVLVDQLLTGTMVGMTLHTSAPEMYRALIEGTAFGALTIIKRIEEYGVKVEEVVNCGGIAEKSPLIMQIYADVCNRPMKLSRSSQTCALGAAIFGAVAGGAFETVSQAQQQMTGLKETVYEPNRDAVEVYQKLYALYRSMHDAFGVKDNRENLYHVMKDLIAIRESVCKNR